MFTFQKPTKHKYVGHIKLRKRGIISFQKYSVYITYVLFYI